jgi:tetratricopeptide (TPR) repeat protein
MNLQHLSARRVGDLRLSLALGSLLQEVSNDVDQALFRYRLANCSDSAALWNNVALCLAAKGRLVAAVCCLKRSVYLSPLYWPSQHNLALLQLQLKQYASAFQHLKCAAALTGAQCAPVLSLLATCLECLQDPTNSRAAHQAAIQAAQITLNPLPVINFAIFLHNLDLSVNRNEILRLLQQFEQSWLKRNRYAAEFDQRLLESGTRLCAILQIDTPMAWMKPSNSIQPSQASTNLSTQHAEC